MNICVRDVETMLPREIAKDIAEYSAENFLCCPIRYCVLFKVH